MDKKTIAEVLTEIATILELLGENPFKVKAHQNAARAVETLAEDIHHLAANHKLTDIKGVGKAIAEKIETMITTGHLPELEELRAKIPPGIFEMMKIPGLGPKKVKAIWDRLGVTTVGELQYACNENRLAQLDGFGAKSQDNILKGINLLAKFKGRRLLSDGLSAAAPILEHITKKSPVIRAQIAGSLRRSLETVKDIDIVTSSDNPAKVMDVFIKSPGVVEITGHGDTKSSVILESGMAVDLRVVTDEEYPFALHHFTGSREHNTMMRGLAKSHGLKMNEYGFFRDDTRIHCRDETEIFKTLGLSYIPPEMREGLDEIELAKSQPAPALVEPADIKGVFHCHSVYSDGADTIADLVVACKKLGYKYLGLSDHSRTASYAGGLSIDDLKRQSDEIDEINEKHGDFRVFKGVESDILPDGSLDYPDAVLENLDFVIASVHSSFNMDEKKMTQRILHAVRNPFTTILGHPTGRLLLSRDGYAVNMPEMIEALAERGVAMELNANPHRLDVDWRVIPAVLRAGVKISINPDAHRIAGLADTRFGVMIARKGGCARENIFNTVDTAHMEKLLRRNE